MIRKNVQVSDDRLVWCEWYNPGKYAVELIRQHDKEQYIVMSGISLGPAKIILKPGEWVIVSHRFYIGRCMGGSPTVTLITNEGRTMGIGNKLPSAPLPELSNRKN